jgi:hypothetical protein
MESMIRLTNYTVVTHRRVCTPMAWGVAHAHPQSGCGYLGMVAPPLISEVILSQTATFVKRFYINFLAIYILMFLFL